jgi:hypothetical protein
MRTEEEEEEEGEEDAAAGFLLWNLFYGCHPFCF